MNNDEQLSLFLRRQQHEDIEPTNRSMYDKNVLMHAVTDDVARCHSCKLGSTRLNTVPGEGNLDARVMFVGEGPGADEDLKGRPFVGAAGKLLDAIINAMGMKREEVFIGNVVKCRPPSNRVPEKDEIDTCIVYLKRQIEIIKPKVIVLLGSTAYKAMIPGSKDGITKARGNFIQVDGTEFMPTFHPAALLRDPSRKTDVWHDMKKVMSLLREEM